MCARARARTDRTSQRRAPEIRLLMRDDGVPTVYFAFVPLFFVHSSSSSSPLFSSLLVNALCRGNRSTAGSLYANGTSTFEFHDVLPFLRHNRNFMDRPPSARTRARRYTHTCTHILHIIQPQSCIVNTGTKRGCIRVLTALFGR